MSIHVVVFNERFPDVKLLNGTLLTLCCNHYYDGYPSRLLN